MPELILKVELGAAMEKLGDIWESCTKKQRSTLVMFSDAPLNTPLDAKWSELPDYSKIGLLDSFLEGVR